MNTIIAEITKNWTINEPITDTISQRFENVITTNESNGYKLKNWKFSQIVQHKTLTETIIAEFTKQNQET